MFPHECPKWLECSPVCTKRDPSGSRIVTKPHWRIECVIAILQDWRGLLQLGYSWIILEPLPRHTPGTDAAPFALGVEIGNELRRNRSHVTRRVMNQEHIDLGLVEGMQAPVQTRLGHISPIATGSIEDAAKTTVRRPPGRCLEPLTKGGSGHEHGAHRALERARHTTDTRWINAKFGGDHEIAILFLHPASEFCLCPSKPVHRSHVEVTNACVIRSV